MKTTSQIQTTSLEDKVLQAIAQSEYRSSWELADLDEPVWTFSVTDDFADQKPAAGAIGSLSKKGLVESSGDDDGPNSATIWLTPAGIQKIAALRIDAREKDEDHAEALAESGPDQPVEEHDRPGDEPAENAYNIEDGIEIEVAARELREIEKGQAEMAREDTWLVLLETAQKDMAERLARELRERWDINWVSIQVEGSPETTEDQERFRVIARSTFRTYRYGRNDWLVPLTDEQALALGTWAGGWKAGWQAGRLG